MDDMESERETLMDDVELEREMFFDEIDWEKDRFLKLANLVSLMIRDDLDQYPPHLQSSIQTMEREIDFLQIFYGSLPYPEGPSEDDDDWHSRSLSMMLQFKQAVEIFLKEYKGASEEDKIANWERMSSGFLQMIELSKPVIKQICILLLCEELGWLRDDNSGGASFIQLIQKCLLNLQVSTHDLIALVEKQFAFIQDKLTLFETMFFLSESVPSDHYSRLGELISHARDWANHISLLVSLYWTAEVLNDSVAKSMGIVLSDLMEVYMPYSPQVIALYLDGLLALRYAQPEHLRWMFPQLLVHYVDFLHEHLVLSGVEPLNEELLFLLSFLFDREAPYYKDPTERQLIEVEIHDIIITEVPSIICDPHTSNLSTFLHRTDAIKIKVRDLYAFAPLPPPSLFCLQDEGIGLDFFLKRDSGLLDSFLKKLQDVMEQEAYYIHSIKRRMTFVQEELASLSSFMLDLKIGNEELQAIWTRVVKVVYFAGLVADFCSSKRLTIWYGILCLPTLIHEIELVKFKRRQIEDDAFPLKSTYSSTEEIFIGFEKEEKDILHQLLYWCNKKLTIIYILGMGGQGKTTLAKRIYNHPSIHYHFLKVVWCSVSVKCNPETLLANIARDLGCYIDGEIEHLIEHISRSLKGTRYLIVLDDVWDLELWKLLQSSLPNDKNGSRVLFTSRNEGLTKEAKSAYHDRSETITNRLRFFTDEESWELIQNMVFDCEGCPSYLLRIGKEIAVFCKGLPLAVTQIALVLKRKDAQLELWEEVATNFLSHLACEGFMDLLAPSYEHLPYHLKSFFLHLGSFPRGQNISVKKLQRLWMAEKIMVDEIAGPPCLDVRPLEFLYELVSLSLVVDVERGRKGEMKSCKVHELLYDLCLEKAMQNNFLQLVDGNTIMGECYSNTQKHEFQFQHRICIHQSGSFTPPKSVCTTKLSSDNHVHSILCSGYCPDLHQRLCSFLTRFKVLTTLDLEDMYLPDFPQVILQNIHLRYLALRGLIEHIPHSIVDLCSLETIIVKRQSLSTIVLPATFWVKKSLKYVHIDRIGLPSPNDKFCIAENCNIVVLSGILLEYGVRVEEFMKRLTRLKEMKCFCINEVMNSMWFGCLEELESMHVRNIHSGNSSMHPHQSVPTFNFPTSLKKLVMEECGLPWSCMSLIGNLPHLEVLKLRKWACVGTTWSLGNGGFSKLTCLELFDLDIERIDYSACKEIYPFLDLRKLLLLHCLGAEDLLACFKNCNWLRTIDISGSLIAPNSARKFKEHRDEENSLVVLEVLGLDYDDDMGDKEE